MHLSLGEFESHRFKSRAAVNPGQGGMRVVASVIISHGQTSLIKPGLLFSVF